MKELVEYIVKHIVTNPDLVEVTESMNGSEIMLSLKVADEDMGIVIGKKGQTIRSIRKLLTVRAINDGVRVNLSLVDVRENASDEETATNEEAAAESEESEEEKSEETASEEPVTETTEETKE
jgi:predicted RNA-binding protein YlqC (UPF0109 family)